MKVWKNKNIIETYLFVLILTGITTAGSVYVYVDNDNRTADLVVFIMTILSVLIALLAYHISVKTYVSIDAVNAMSRMDGNVMEIKDYRTGILAMMRYFNGATQEEAAEAVLHHIETAFGKKHDVSGAKMADSIQEVIDITVLISLVIKPEHKDASVHDSNQQYINRIKAALTNIDKRVKDLDEMSEGSCILLKESVKLIKAVISYQLFSRGCGEVDQAFLLMDVRGSMLKNAISRTIYFNYIGLFYLKKGIMVIQESNPEIKKNGMFTINSLRQLPQIKQSPDYQLAIIYLNEAIHNFNKAVTLVDDEVMWNSFIQYNKARAEYLVQGITGENGNAWKTSMNQAISYRGRLNMLIEDITDHKSTYFQRAFSSQYHMANLMKMLLEIASQEDLTNEIGDCILPRTAYSKLRDASIMDIGDDEFRRLRYIKADIMAEINK